ncbi:hypothetical protein EZS27_011143 [termite gut metagenome]|uniref:Transposase n=1 Tax=termite gut metagenome TaxID=433724 RepID=A0A5J4S6J3_9ZZZZ
MADYKQHEMKYVASDYWKPYERIVPKEKHLQTKAETFTVEGYKSLFRHFLARMRPKINMLFQMQENVGIVILAFNALQKWYVVYLKLTIPKIIP